MRSRLGSFNCILVAALGLAGLAVGCRSPQDRNKAAAELSTLRLFLETEFDTTGDKTAVVPVYRASPVLVRIAREPFLDEGAITDAQVVDVVGGFAIALRFNLHGTWVLDNITTSYRGQRMVIHSHFTEGRWLAAPKITARLKDGVLVFTPDASREEAERIVRGLNHVAVKLGNRPKPSKPPAKPPRAPVSAPSTPPAPTAQEPARPAS